MMTINPDRAALEARQLLDNELLNFTLTRLESAALEKAVQAKPADHELRASAMADIRAVRSLRQAFLNLIEEDEAKGRRKGKPA